jgi:ribokinase
VGARARRADTAGNPARRGLAANRIPRRSQRRCTRGGADTVILKLGAKGAAVARRGAPVRRIEPFRVRAVDSTAAGDAFNGALAVALAEGVELEEAVRFANAAGALCCTAAGAQPALPARRAVDRLLRDARR